MKTLGLLFLVAVVLIGCNKKEGADEEKNGQIEIQYFAFQEEEDGLWGIMSTDGTVLVKPKFSGYPSCVLNDRFFVQEDNVCTLYSAEKRPKKIGTYKESGAFTSDVCPVKDMNDNIYYIDKDGKKAIEFDKIDGKEVAGAYNFHCGRAMVCLEDESWGYIDESGDVAIPFKYADAWNFSEDLAIVYLDKPTFEEGDQAKWCVIDTEGNKLFTKRFGDMRPSEFTYADGLLEVIDQDENYILLDRDGKVVQKLKPHCYSIYINDGLFVVYNIDTSKAGLMDKEGEWVIRPKYQSIVYNGSLLVCAEEEQEYSLYTIEGERIASLPHGYVNLFDKEYKDHENYLLAGSWEDGYQLVDPDGNVVETDCEIHGFNTGYSWGFMDIGGGEEEYYEEDYSEEDFEE